MARLSVVAATCGLLSLGVVGVASASTYQCFDGDDVFLLCWESGESINGDSIWYRGFDDDTFPGSLSQEGFVSGYYVGTGHDPAAGVDAC